MKRYTFREFARITQTTIRTLRYYEKRGLLKSMEDEKQKYLEEDQLISLKTIQLLAKAGYTLEEIKDIVEPHFISEKNKEKLQNKKANGWRVMPYSTA